MNARDHEFQTEIPVRLRYRAYMPDHDAGAPGGGPPPLVVYLHGAAPRGEDLARVDEQGLARKLAGGETVPFAVVAPLCPRNLDWSMILPALDALVVHATAELRADPDRVYLTGSSMGGFGVWALASEFPHRFAAAAPICGGGRHLLDFPGRLRRMVDVPVWCFHGEQDEEIPVGESLRLVEALRAYGGNVRCTVYPGVGHDSWTRAYDDPELYAWFLRHRRRRSAANQLAS